jgi:hypothetical protein
MLVWTLGTGGMGLVKTVCLEHSVNVDKDLSC